MSYYTAIRASGATTTLIVDNFPEARVSVKVYNGSGWDVVVVKVRDVSANAASQPKIWDGSAWV